MKRLIVVILLLLCVGCMIHPNATFQASTSYPETATNTSLPTSTVIIQTPTVTADQHYVGYWLKLSKQIDEHNTQSLQLLYQNGNTVSIVSEFCVRDGNSKTINGFYFLAADRKAIYSTAPDGFDATVFPHNYIYKFKKYSNYYIHPAPWNNKGENGCPYNSGGGCINMRWDDFNVFHDGGNYTNPFSSKIYLLPKAQVGTPFVILENGDSCKLLEECMNFYNCSSFHECFVRYTCELCENPENSWLEMNSPKPTELIFQDDF